MRFYYSISVYSEICLYLDKFSLLFYLSIDLLSIAFMIFLEFLNVLLLVKNVFFFGFFSID